MGIQPDMYKFRTQPHTDTLTFVDMRPEQISDEDIKASRVVELCRKTLGFARDNNIPQAYVYGHGEQGIAPPDTDKWIDGFEPRSTDQVFLRRQLSCFSSPYFGESLCSRGRIILAGFLGSGGGLATCIDAYLAGAEITLLADALYDPLSRNIISEQAVRHFSHKTETGIRIQSVDEWIKSQVRGLTP